MRWCGLVLAVAVLAVGGCKGKGPASARSAKPCVVGFSQVGAESSWRTAETKSVTDEANSRGVKLQTAMGDGRQDKQVAAIRSFINQKVDVIVLAPVVDTGWDNVLAEARKANIPVVLLDRGVQSDPGLYTTLVTADTVEEGRLAGQFLADQAKGKMRIVELEGTTGSTPATDRHKGFQEVLVKHPNMTVVFSQDGDFKRAKGKEVMEAALKSLGATNIDAVFAHNDDMALGAVQAIREAGRIPGKDIRLVSIDGVKAAFGAMLKGELNASIECNPLFGPLLLDTIEKIRAGKSVQKVYRNKPKLYDMDMAPLYFGSREY